ncbi:hypothetical protein M3Y94_00606500 [Aphelenchoides besseyi]|nr:hypothetical protein M3Y94_00606500 [Aphelenchoides besseyi]KAI6222272.1 Zf-LYAR domain-containing protein [Aphelenchoides besseyi]
MTFFTCSNCGLSMKRKKVANHQVGCPNGAFQCFDCSRIFTNGSYFRHVCPVFRQKRQQLYAAPATANSEQLGPLETQIATALSQEQWHSVVQFLVDKWDRSSEHWQVMCNVRTHNNVPRRRQAFVNFLRNSCHLHWSELATEIWDKLVVDYAKFAETDELKTVIEQTGVLNQNSQAMDGGWTVYD